MFSVLLLAAGYGSRLAPLTQAWPKCLMPIRGKPLLAYWLEISKAINADHVYVNVHHLASEVQYFLGEVSDCVPVSTVHEEILCGTAGTIRNLNLGDSDGTLMVVHADNLCVCDFDEFLKFHQLQRNKNCPITMMTFDCDEPSQAGIVDLDANGFVANIHEKMPRPPSNLANGAVYLVEREVLSFIESNPWVSDFSTQVLPEFMGRIGRWHNHQLHIDIGSIGRLKKAERLAKQVFMPPTCNILSQTWTEYFKTNPIHKLLNDAKNNLK